MDADTIAAALNDLDQLIAIHEKCCDLIQTHLGKFNPDL